MLPEQLGHCTSPEMPPYKWYSTPIYHQAPMTSSAGQVARPWFQAVSRGFRRRCPQCGKGRIFSGYTRVAQSCDHCQEEMFHQRADDAPPYMTIMIVGHIVVPGLLMMERTWSPPTWVQMSVWLPVTLILALAFLPLTKGAIVGLQWSLRMHGFGGQEDNI
jgi:uncharacterized protein (DUF983 family)